MLPDVRILSPAAGLPALLKPQQPLHLLALTTLADNDLRNWATQLHLRPVGSQLRVDLSLANRTNLSTTTPPAIVAEAVALAHPGQRLVEIELTPEATASAAQPYFRVADLYRGESRIRGRCVAWQSMHLGRPLHLAFASDLHVAAIWNHIDAATARHAPDLHPGFLHPGRLVRRFVETANALAAAGELDLVVLGGDLVDHVRTVSDARTGDDNVTHFNEILADLVVPSFAIPGNHDYRLHPWRPRIYPYEAVCLPPRRAAAILRAADLWDRTPWRWSDLRALRTTDEAGRTALASHLLELAPATDYEIELAELRLLFLNTGRDVLPQWHGIERGRRTTFLRSLPTCWEHPDSEGLTLPQVARVRQSLSQPGGAAIFLHAPLFNPPPGVRVEDHTAQLDPGDGEQPDSRFEGRLFGSGLRQGVFFRNPGQLLRSLAGTRAAASLFSGHVHRAHTFALDRQRLTARSMAFGQSAAGASEVTFVNAPAVGQTAHTAGEAPGFVHARFAAGTLRHVRCIEL